MFPCNYRKGTRLRLLVRSREGLDSQVVVHLLQYTLITQLPQVSAYHMEN